VLEKGFFLLRNVPVQTASLNQLQRQIKQDFEKSIDIHHKILNESSVIKKPNTPFWCFKVGQ